MRTKHSLRNILVTSLSYFVTTITGLVLRKIFLRYLGLGYTGLDSVYSNVLSFLALAELGVGAAITYKLYKPLAEKNTDEVSSLMAVYKILYRIIALVVLTIGTILCFVIPKIVKDPPIVGLPLIISYYLFLSSSVCSYLFAYKRSLILADQRQYYITIIDIIFNLLFFSLKLFVVWKYQNYFVFLVLNIFRVLLGNLVVSYICDKSYPNILNKTYTFKETMTYARGLVKDFEYILLHKVCSYVYSSTDAIVISSFMGVGNVGLLANYNLIVTVVNNLFMQCSSSIQASMGNLVYSSQDSVQIKRNVSRLSFLYHMILSFFCTSLFCLLSPFIVLWIGKEYVLAQSIVAIICLNMYTFLFHQPIGNLYTVTGLFKEDKLTSAIAAIINLSLSIILVDRYGFIGVYVGTLLGSLAYLVGRTLIVYKHVFNENAAQYFWLFLRYLAVACCDCTLSFELVGMVDGDTIEFFIIKCLICVLIPNLLNILIFWRTEECKYSIGLIHNLVKRKVI